MEQDRNILIVRTFGGFSFRWNDMEYSGSARCKDAQFLCLMSALLHNRESGVSRDQLVHLLFGERKLNNVGHSLSVVIYHAQKKLRELGLPDVGYIERHDGCFYWTREIRVREDTDEFAESYQRAQTTEDPEERLELYLCTAALYTGDFLPMLERIDWVSGEAKRYRMVFADSVEAAASLLRKHGDYERLEKLGKHAASAQPFHGWEYLTGEALIALNRFDEAQELLLQTEEYYYREMRLPLDRRMLALQQRIESARDFTANTLFNIRQLFNREAGGDGGLLCTFPYFEEIYRQVLRQARMEGRSPWLLACVEDPEQTAEACTAQQKMETALGEVLRRSVGNCDVVTRYGKGVYLVLTPDASREESRLLQKKLEEVCNSACGGPQIKVHLSRA